MASEQQKPLLEFRGVETYYGRIQILKGVNYTVHAGEMEYSMCTSCPEVLDFLENSTANLFRLVPGLAGLKLITASEYTHHCLAFATPVWPGLFKTQYDSLCPRCRDRDAVQMVAEIVNRITGNEAGIKFTERRDWDVKTRLLSSIEKAHRLLDYEPKTGFEDGIGKVHRWFKDNWDDICRCAEF